MRALIELLVSARRLGPSGSQLVIRVYEDLNLGFILGLRDLFWGFWDFFLGFWDFFRDCISIFLVFSVSDFGVFSDFFIFWGILGLFLGIWDFFGIFVRVYEGFFGSEPLGKDTNDAVGSFNDYHSSRSNKLKSNH